MNSTLKIQQMLSWQQMLFYLLLTLFSSSAPAPTHHSADVQSPLSVDWEEARQIWSELRLSKKQLTAAAAARTRRSTPTPMPPDHAALNSLSEVPSYVKELYWNISVKGSEDIDTTTIRSLPALHQGDGESWALCRAKYYRHRAMQTMRACALDALCKPRMLIA